MPQARRQEAQERARKGLPANDEEPDKIVTPSRDAMVLMLMSLGMARADAEKEYEAQAEIARAAGEHVRE